MVKADPSLQMKIRQYLISARRNPSEKEPNPEVISMRIFAQNEVVARSKFWYQTRQLNKLKRANGEILAVNEIYEKNTRHIKTYGIVVRYQSRTGTHNMYREYRDISLNGAISQLYLEMSARHGARHETIQIVRTALLTRKTDIRRPYSEAWRSDKIKFPITKFIPRSTEKRFNTTFKARRPTTVRK